MSSISKAAWHSTIGVAWRLAVFLIIIACFAGLSSLKAWHSSYAASPALAAMVAEREDLDWSQVMSRAIAAMPEPARQYTDKEIFYKSIKKQLERLGGPGDEVSQKIKDYQDALQKKKDIEKSLSSSGETIADLEKSIDSKSGELKETAAKIAQAQRDHDNAGLKALADLKASIREDIRDLSTQLIMFEAGRQKQLVDLSASIKSSEDGLREAFAAALPAARRVNGRIAKSH